ncbi:Putative outer membrane porin protein (fragment) [Paraburkholderia piptadeniae]|uniref:Outer membrane porin protein n=1 Tax=Paraburkholderia piptadeniae TaxID=1701573 RepID=A0A1N7SN38_9BURK
MFGGFLDEGVATYRDSGGARLFQMQDSAIFPTKFFFRGSEDMAGPAHQLQPRLDDQPEHRGLIRSRAARCSRSRRGSGSVKQGLAASA